MKKFILILSLFLIGEVLFTPEYKLSVVAKPGYLRRGESGKATISIELPRRTYIKPAPPLIIKCLPVEGVVFPKEIFKVSELDLPILQKKELSYVDIKKGIDIPFSIEEKAKPGRRELVFELKFLLCSESKNICSKVVERVNVKIFISRRIRK